MSNPYETREQRQKIYDYYADSLRTMAADSATHADNCDAGPLCIGGEAAEILGVLFMTQPAAAVLYTIVAVRELRRSGERENALARRLEIQRGLTEESAKALDERNRECEELLYRISVLEQAAGIPAEDRTTS